MMALNTRSHQAPAVALMNAHSAPAAPGREWWERPVTEGSVAAPLLGTCRLH